MLLLLLVNEFYVNAVFFLPLYRVMAVCGFFINDTVRFIMKYLEH